MNISIDKNDEELVVLVQMGDQDSFGTLVERYENKLLRYGRKFLSTHEDIEDIVQDVFINSYRNIQSFDPSLRFSPWIYRIAHNAFANALRKRSRNPLFFVDFDTFLAHPIYEDPEPVEKEREQLKKQLDVVLDRISPKYREVLVLHYLEDLSYKEMADILEVPTGTIGIRLKRAREALKKIYTIIHPDLHDNQ